MDLALVENGSFPSEFDELYDTVCLFCATKRVNNGNGRNDTITLRGCKCVNSKEGRKLGTLPDN